MNGLMNGIGEKAREVSDIHILQIYGYLESIYSLEKNIKYFKKTNNEYGILEAKEKIKEFKKLISKNEKNMKKKLSELAKEYIDGQNKI